MCVERGGNIQPVLYCAYEEILTEACVAASNSVLRHAAGLKFPEIREQRAGYQLAFEAKGYDLRERRYEQFYIRNSGLLRSWCCLPQFSVCYPGWFGALMCIIMIHQFL